MPVDFPYNAAMTAIRDLVRSAYGIPDHTPVPEAGDDPIQVVPADLPMAMLEVEGAISVASGDMNRGAGAENVASTWTVYCWMLRQKTQGARDVETLRNLLAAMGPLLYADRSLGGKLTNSSIKGIDWTGRSRQWPVEIVEGQAMQAGYVAIECVIVEYIH